MSLLKFTRHFNLITRFHQKRDDKSVKRSVFHGNNHFYTCDGHIGGQKFISDNWTTQSESIYDHVVYKPPPKYCLNKKSKLSVHKSRCKKLFSDPFFSRYRYRGKIITWLIASIGLLWQIYQVSVIYFEFKTRIDIDIDIPRNITMPALTVCLQLVSNPTLVGKYFPSENFSRSDYRSWYRYLPANILSELATEYVDIVCRTPFPELSKINPQGSDICENYVSSRISLQYDWERNSVHKCVTYYYRKPKADPIQVITADAKDFYWVQFRTPNNLSIAIVVHNPIEILHFIEADTFHFWSQQTDQIILVTTKVTTHLLPSPYRTDCVPYSDLEFGRLSCIYNCRVNQVSKDCLIWPKDVPITRTVDLPFQFIDKPCAQPERHYCNQRSICKRQCTNHWYTTTLISSREKRLTSNLTNLYVRRPFGAELVYKYGPRLTEIEFICYVASCFGIWFGISVGDIFRFTFHQGAKQCGKPSSQFANH